MFLGSRNACWVRTSTPNGGRHFLRLPKSCQLTEGQSWPPRRALQTHARSFPHGGERGGDSLRGPARQNAFRLACPGIPVHRARACPPVGSAPCLVGGPWDTETPHVASLARGVRAIPVGKAECKSRKLN